MAGTLGNEGTTAANVAAPHDKAVRQHDLPACSIAHTGRSPSFMKRDAARMKRRDETLARAVVPSAGRIFAAPPIPSEASNVPRGGVSSRRFISSSRPH